MNQLLENGLVAIFQDTSLNEYPSQAPFHPSTAYPEYPFRGVAGAVAPEENRVYDAVRQTLHLLKLDKEHYDTQHWNPLSELIKPGDHVVVKPNFVLDQHSKGGDLEAIVSNPAVIRAVVDYVYLALGGEGEIIIADAPQADCNFENLLRQTNAESITSFYQDSAAFNVPIYDLRQLRVSSFEAIGSRTIFDGDPKGYAIVDLANKSALCDFSVEDFNRLYGADYDRKETEGHHSKNTNEYCVSKTVLCADVVISLPKFKSHRKAGATLNLKNLVGINGNKNYLPHFRIGTAQDGGDEFCSLTREQKNIFYTRRVLTDKLLAKPNKVKAALYTAAYKSYRLLKPLFYKNVITEDTIAAGDWHGNDTIWRTVLDLNKILIYADATGKIHQKPQRRFFSLIDGVIAGDGEGPLTPETKPCGVIIAGFNPLTVDLVAVRLAGFDAQKIPLYRNALKMEFFPLTTITTENINVESNIQAYQNLLRNNVDKYLGFKPAKGWVDHIEI